VRVFSYVHALQVRVCVCLNEFECQGRYAGSVRVDLNERASLIICVCVSLCLSVRLAI